MHGLHRSHKNKNSSKQNSGYSSSNPFDDEVDNKTKTSLKASQRSSSEPKLDALTFGSNPFDDNVSNDTSSYSNSIMPSRSRYKNDFRDSGGIESQSVQELEGYAIYKAEETTKAVNGCLKVAEDMREDATKTLVALHQQGEQITRTHMVAADMDHDLSRGEKLLGSLGGLMSRTWKPKKTSPIKGPMITRDDVSYKRGNHLELRGKLGLGTTSKGRSSTRTPTPEPTDTLQKVEVEKAKQDDALSDLSDILSELKEMALDMGSEIDIQNQALGHAQDDVDTINDRVLQANRRARGLLGK